MLSFLETTVCNAEFPRIGSPLSQSEISLGDERRDSNTSRNDRPTRCCLISRRPCGTEGFVFSPTVEGVEAAGWRVEVLVRRAGLEDSGAAGLAGLGV